MGLHFERAELLSSRTAVESEDTLLMADRCNYRFKERKSTANTLLWPCSNGCIPIPSDCGIVSTQSPEPTVAKHRRKRLQTLRLRYHMVKSATWTRGVPPKPGHPGWMLNTDGGNE